MKNIFEDDDFESLTIVDNRKPKESESCNKKCCGNCRYYQRHYIFDGLNKSLKKVNARTREVQGQMSMLDVKSS